MKGYWYCENCTEEVAPKNVTYQELHDTCGHPVDWIEPTTKLNIPPEEQKKIREHIDSVLPDEECDCKNRTPVFNSDENTIGSYCNMCDTFINPKGKKLKC